MLLISPPTPSRALRKEYLTDQYLFLRFCCLQLLLGGEASEARHTFTPGSALSELQHQNVTFVLNCAKVCLARARSQAVPCTDREVPDS